MFPTKDESFTQVDQLGHPSFDFFDRTLGCFNNHANTADQLQSKEAENASTICRNVNDSAKKVS